MSGSIYSTEECERIACEASLRYVNTSQPGYSRCRRGRGYAFYKANGDLITDSATIKRIKSLAIPPAYNNVWICPYANGHIQAIGYDERGRKQYRYHPLWHETRNQQKFHCIAEFGRALPTIRQHIHEKLNQPVTLEKEQVICAILYLLDTCHIRIGNAIYAKENQSYGLTTLRKKHLTLTNQQAVLNFPGKSSKPWNVVLKNKKIINILKKCEEIPGYELFKYLDESNQVSTISSQDINHYLKQLTCQTFTAKDFRTWTACRETLAQCIACDPELSLKQIIDKVAKLLGHTPSICQKNYIHASILEWHKENKYASWVSRRKKYLSNLDSDQLLLYWLSKI